nr:ORF109C [Acipenserid herpesvirus 1]
MFLIFFIFFTDKVEQLTVSGQVINETSCELTCSATKGDNVTITWSVNGIMLTNTKKIIISTQIDQTKPIMCNGSNPVSFQSIEVNLNNFCKKPTTTIATTTFFETTNLQIEEKKEDSFAPLKRPLIVLFAALLTTGVITTFSGLGYYYYYYYYYYYHKRQKSFNRGVKRRLIEQ